VDKKAGARAANTDGSKSARTRKRLLDAAAHVLSRKGFAGTRLVDVAEQAQIQAPAIYYYFGSREELIEEVMWTGIAHLTEHVQQALDQLPLETEPMARIETAVEAHLRFELEVSDYSSAAVRNAGQVPEELRIRYVAESTKYADIWRRLVADAKAAGELRDDIDPRAARMLVLGALNWTAEWWNPRRGSIESIVSTAQSVVRHGLGVPPAVAGKQDKPPRRPRRPKVTTG
jgi:AcrR family transcriptional regulator